MRQCNDAELLSAYANQQSEQAFEVLVERHIALVYSAAMREVQNPQLAEEVTQAAFTILAQKARSLASRTTLSGWLCRTAHFLARNALKSELRRYYREQEAHMQSLINEPPPEIWRQFAPLLDEAVAHLNETDRNAVVLRFFQQKTLNEVGDLLGVAPDAAQKRVSRALETLRKFFARRGVNSTTAAIAENISAHSIQDVPATLAKSVTAAALAKSAMASTSTLTLIKGASKAMAWSKAKTAIVAGVGILFVAGTATVAVKEIKTHRPEIWQAGFDMSVLDQVLPQAKILPALPSRDPNINSWRGRPDDGKIMGLNDSATEILSAAYGIPRARMTFLTPLPEGKYDFISNVSGNQRQALQQAIKKTFGLVGSYQLVRTNVLELVVRKPAVALKPSASAGPEFTGANGSIWLSNQPMTTLAYFNEYFIGTPVENHTRLSGYYDLKWDSTTNSLPQAELENLGLELVPTDMPVKMLVVEKAK